MPDSVGKRKRRDVTARKHAAREERRVARAGRKKDREAGLIEPGPPIGPAEQSEFLVVEPEADAADADAQSSEDKPSPKLEARPKSEDGKGPGEQNEESAGESAKESGGPGASAGSSSRSERT
jgi:hypothetical protein